MGAVNSCTCDDDKKYRFKGFIVSVYPDNKHGGPDEDALGKLNSYVASNPERIPRVCRKITKILRRHLREGKEDRVMVSVMMLLSLIQHSKRVDGFLPHSLDICALLLAAESTRYHVGAADVLSVLCYRLSTLPNTDASRRLIADNKDRLVPRLLKMTSDHIASRKDLQSAQTRYAAIQALGHIANCIHAALAGSVSAIMHAIIVNLILVLRERAQKPLSEESVKLLAERHYGGAGGTAVESPLLQLPNKPEDQDVVYALACSHGIGAAAACTTTAGVEDLLNAVTTLLDQQSGWMVPYVPALVFSDIVSAMQRRPQQLGFSVYQCLCDVGERTVDPSVRIGVLRSLQACMDTLPMTGARPAVVLSYLEHVMALSIACPARTADAEAVKVTNDTHDAVVRLTSRLLRATYRQHNAPQLQNILASLWGLLRATKGDANRNATLPLRLLVVAAPYVRTMPLADRSDMQVTATLDVFLNSGGDDALRYLAARVLTGVLAGLPEESYNKANNTANAAKAASNDAGTSAPTAPLLLPSMGGTLCTDEQDVAYAQEWVKKMVKVTDGVTPRSIVAVANVLCAMMAGYGVSGMPFTLMFLWSLQQRCVRAGEATANNGTKSPTSRARSPSPSATARAAGGEAAEDAASASTGAPTTNMLASRTATSPLTRAWLHMVAASLVNCGNVYNVPKLTAYAQEVLGKRATAGQLASCFEPALRPPERPADVYTISGLRYLASDMSRALSAEATEPPVAKLPSFSYVANIIVDADRPEIGVVFGANEQEELHTIIEDVCFQPDSEMSVSLQSALAARDAEPAGAATAAPAFTLAADDDGKVRALQALHISVVDNCLPCTQDSRGGIALSVDADTTAKQVEEIERHWNVNADTQVLPPETLAALPPLPMPPSPTNEEEEETSVGTSASSGALSGGAASKEVAVWVNPLDIDMGISGASKSHTVLSVAGLPAARYVTLS